MQPSEIFQTLWVWTPFLLEGFSWNVLIAVSAVFIGVMIGAILAVAKASDKEKPVAVSTFIANTCYKLPTTAILFYLAILMPREFQLLGQTIEIPVWIKAALALSTAQIGFTADNLASAIRFWREGKYNAALLFVPNLGNNLLITVVASSSASLVGVSELVSRCNKMVNALDNDALVLPLYFYASLFFLTFCGGMMLVFKAMRVHLGHQMESRALLEDLSA